MEYTSEQLNYFRICHVAFNLVPKGLRQVFKKEWDFLFKTTSGEWKDTPKNGSDFCNKEFRKICSKNSRYLATIQNGNTAEWDCSCLFFAILFSVSIGTTLSGAIRKVVNDLRPFRNEIAHISEAKLTDAEFRGYVDRVLLAFTSLNLPISDIEAVKNQTSFRTAEVNDLMANVANLQSKLKVAQDTIQEKEEQVECLTQEMHSKVKSFRTLTVKPSHKIIRRSNEVTRIMAKMQELDDGSNGAVSTIYLSGNPGCGKTQLARQIGKEFFTRGSGESEGLTFVATLNAETLETLADSYLSQAKQLGISEYALAKLATAEELNPKERIQQLRCLIFPQFRQFSKWLIIADNVVNLSLVYEYLPQTASEEWGHGQVLITTQDTSAIPTNAPHTYHESLSGGMQPGDAVELLNRVSEMSNSEKAKTVADALDYQPLSLAAAASYVHFVSRFSTYNWSKFLTTLADVEREVTEERLTQVNSAYPKKMTDVIQLAIDTTLKRDEVLRQAFLFFLLCDSEPVPIQAAVNFVNNRTSGQTDELITAKILNSSLIMRLYSEDGAPGYLRVHNVVHQVLRKMSLMAVTEKHECLSVAVQVFHSLIESEQHRLHESGDGCVLLRRITTHCKALYEVLKSTFPAVVWVKELIPFLSPDGVVSWLCSTASVFCNLADSSNAILFSTSAYDFVQYISSDTIKADVFNVHGLTLSMKCKYEASISCLEKATKTYTEIYGEHDCKVAESYNNLGGVYQDLGHYNEAKEYHEKALIIKKEIFGEENDQVAASYNKLGSVFQALGQYNEAKGYHEKALITRKKIFGEEHDDVGTSYNNLGNVCQALGQYNKAKEYLEKALIIRKKIFGEEHDCVATSCNILGRVYQALAQYNKAKEYHEKALVIRKAIFGEKHAKVAGSYKNLGSVYHSLGQYNKAKEYSEKALDIRKAIFGEEHAKVAASYDSLGSVYQALGQYNKAQDYLGKALNIMKKVFGEGHDYVATSYNNLGNVHQALGQYNEAKEYHEKALIIGKKIFSEKNASVATSYNNLGNIYQALGQHNKAKEHHGKALIIRKEIFGEEHDDVGTSYNNLGNLYQALGQYIEAEEYHDRALMIRKKIFDEEHHDVGSSYNNLGNVYQALGQYKEAKEYHEKALIIRKKIFGEEHANVATSYNNLGNVYHALGRYNEAKEYHEKALIITKKIFGEEHAYVTTSYNNLGNVSQALGQYNEAKEYLEKALIIAKKIFGEGHGNVTTSYNNLGNVYHSLGQYNEAKEYHEKALVIREKIFGEKHAIVATSYNNLGNVYHALERYNEAKEYHEKALIITKTIFGEEHAYVAGSYNNLGNVYQALGRYNEAKGYHEKALIITKKIYRKEHANAATSYSNLGYLYQSLGQYNEAKEYHQKALNIRKKIFGEEHANVA